MTFVSFHYCNDLKLGDVLKHIFKVNFSNCVVCVFQTYRRQMAEITQKISLYKSITDISKGIKFHYWPLQKLSYYKALVSVLNWLYIIH